jgi:hypothetical protein
MTFPRFFRAINNAGHRFDEAAALGEPLSIRRKAGKETAFVALMPNRGRRPVPMGKKSADPLGELHDTAVLRQRSGLMVPGASVVLS